MLHALSAPWRAYRRLLAYRVDLETGDFWGLLTGVLNAGLLLLLQFGLWPWAIPLAVVAVHVHWWMHWWDFLVEILFGPGTTKTPAAEPVGSTRGAL